MQAFQSGLQSLAGSAGLFDFVVNKVKGVLFLLTLGTGVLTLWDKCPSTGHKPGADSAKHATDSLARQAKDPQHSETTTLLRKRHPTTDIKPATAKAQAENAGGRSGKGAQPPMEIRVPVPLQTAYGEDVEFRLSSAEGNKLTQSVKMTVVLTNRAANRLIWSAVESISDPEGNEYLLKSFTNGASASDNHIPLDTDVPRKCTYTFGGILPTVKMVKLFKFRYRHKSLDDPNAVEFKDIPIDWK